MADNIYKWDARLPISRETIEGGYGDINTTISNVFRGFNHRGVAGIMPENKDNQGYVFFTRPRLNLTHDNAIVSRKLWPYLIKDESSIMRAIRVYLDPVSQLGSDPEYMRGSLSNVKTAKYINLDESDKVDSPLVDKRSPFIHILSECLMTLEGWPDETLDLYTSEPGVMKETYSLVDTYIDNYETSDLTATFRNVKGDVVTFLFRCLMEYMGRVGSGEMIPWPDSIMEYEKDYEIRIWRIVPDETGRKLAKIGSAVAGIPYANPIGQSMNYNRERPYSEDTREISVPLKCVGFEINDPILIEEFNDSIYMYNTDLEKAVLDPTKRDKYVPVPNKLLDYFTYELIMTIDENTWNLVWWAEREYFDSVIKEYQLDG